jgi:hypothetical protein
MEQQTKSYFVQRNLTHIPEQEEEPQQEEEEDY